MLNSNTDYPTDGAGPTAALGRDDFDFHQDHSQATTIQKRGTIISSPRHLASSVWIAIGLLLFTLLVRAQTFGNPVLGYDEQFYLLVGDRIWDHHAVPYVDIFDRKPIGLFLIYAAIRALGGSGIIQYQLVAAAFVSVTAFLIFRAARTISATPAAIVAACLYVIWLNFMEGEGGQAQVFYNLPMLMAGMLVWHVVRKRDGIAIYGGVAMLLVGLALQIKYTAVFEGIFFGLTLVWTQWRTDPRVLQCLPKAAMWVGCALFPTLLVAATYWHIGAIEAYYFANFQSLFGRAPEPLSAQLFGLAEICAVVAPLIAIALTGLRESSIPTGFIKGWLISSIVGVLLFGSFMTTQYALAMLVPLTIASVPFFSGCTIQKWGRYALPLVALIASQCVLYRVQVIKGGKNEALEIADAAYPQHGCIYVYQGYPALYLLDHSCLPTRWVFPNHLDDNDEASAKALGVDPRQEERRILATHPTAIIDETPLRPNENQATHRILESTLDRFYHLSFKQKIGGGHYQLVYRLNAPRVSYP